MKPLNLNPKPRPEQLELAMRPPEVANPVSPFRRGLAPDFRPRITFGFTEKLSPNPRLAENNFQVRLPAIRRPESAIGDEPQRVLSPRRCFALRLGNNLFRHVTRGFLIAREMHGVLGASLRR
jgi:hypothetical protein